MSKYSGTKTEKNLEEAFAGESMARNKYSYFAGAAKKEGYEQIAAIFLETAENEKEHAKLWFKLLNDGVGDTVANLTAAAAGENFEWTTMYSRMADEADSEGFSDVAALMRGVAEVEKDHEQRYLTLVERVKDALVFTRDSEAAWHCRNCGHIHFGKTAPEVCPVCLHAKAYFEVKADNY